MRKTLYKGKFLALLDNDGWEYCQRTHSRGIACIIPVTEDERLVLVEQYRPPLQGVSIELPAGLVGDEPGSEHESHKTAAIRELEEETGYRSENLTPVHHGPSSAGLTSETVVFYYAGNVTQVGPGGGCDGEDITVHAVALSDVHQWLARQTKRGAWIDPKVYAGLYWVNRLRSDI